MPIVDLRPDLPPVRDQQNDSTCVAFALTALHEHGRSGGDLSEQMLFDTAKVLDGTPASAGTTLHHGSTALEVWGQCEEHEWPYGSVAPSRALVYSSGATPHASARRCMLSTIPARIPEIEQAISGGKIVGAGVRMTLDFYNPAIGRVALPVPARIVPAAHAIALVGFDNEAGNDEGSYFILRNSWGSLWGDNGYGYLPYAYFNQLSFPTAVVLGRLT